MPEQAIRDYARLTREDIACIRSLNKAGKTQVEIAQVIGCSQPTVSKWLDVMLDPIDAAKHTLRQGAPELAKRVIQQADVEEALEVLDRLGVAEKRQHDSNRNIGVSIYLGQPGQAAGPAPVIDLSPSSMSLPVVSSALALSVGEAVTD